jgi:hypothetical protein
LAPPDSGPSAQATEAPTRAEKALAIALAFLLGVLTSISLLALRMGWIIFVAVLLWFGVAVRARRIRRYWLVGVAASVPLDATMWFFSLGPFH